MYLSLSLYIYIYYSYSYSYRHSYSYSYSYSYRHRCLAASWSSSPPCLLALPDTLPHMYVYTCVYIYIYIHTVHLSLSLSLYIYIYIYIYILSIILIIIISSPFWTPSWTPSAILTGGSGSVPCCSNHIDIRSIIFDQTIYHLIFCYSYRGIGIGERLAEAVGETAPPGEIGTNLS